MHRLLAIYEYTICKIYKSTICKNIVINILSLYEDIHITLTILYNTVKPYSLLQSINIQTRMI